MKDLIDPTQENLFQLEREQYEARIKELEQQKETLLRGLLDVFHYTNEVATFKIVKLCLDNISTEDINATKTNR